MLEETSLREFLQAVESVRVKESRESVLATPDIQESVVDLKSQRGVTIPSLGASVSRCLDISTNQYFIISLLFQGLLRRHGES